MEDRTDLMARRSVSRSVEPVHKSRSVPSSTAQVRIIRTIQLLRCGSFALSILRWLKSIRKCAVPYPFGGGTHQGHFGACCGGGLAFKVSQVLSWRLPPLLPILVGLVRQVVPQVNVRLCSPKTLQARLPTTSSLNSLSSPALTSCCDS